MIDDAIPIIVGIALSLWTAFGNRWVNRVSSGRGVPTGSPKGCAFTLLWLLVFLLAPLVLVLIAAEKSVSEPSTRISILSIFAWLIPWSLDATALRYAAAPQFAEWPEEDKRIGQRWAAVAGVALLLMFLFSGLAGIGVVALVIGLSLDMSATPTSAEFMILISVLALTVALCPMLGVWLWSVAARRWLPPEIVEIVRARSGLRKRP
jgi:hypothetical protein